MFPFLPDIPGLPSLNPLDMLRNAMMEFVTGLMSLFSIMLGQPATLSGEDLSDSVFTAFLTLALWLTVPVTSLVVVLVMLFRHRLVSVVHAVLVFVSLSAIGTGWFGLCIFLMTFGDQLADVAGWYQRDKDIAIPAFQGVIAAIFGSATIALWGGVLMLVIAFYGIVNYVVIALTPAAFALSPLGRRAQAFFEVLFSIGLVSMVFGRATARLVVDFGRYLMDARNDDNWFIQCTYIAMTFGTAIGVQIWLYKSIHRRIQATMGRMTGTSTSKVSGKVDTTTRKRQPVDVKSVNQAHQASLSPVGVMHVPTQVGASTRPSVRTVVSNQARAQVKKKVLAKAAVSSHPVGRGIVMLHEGNEARKQITAQRRMAARSAAHFPTEEGRM